MGRWKVEGDDWVGAEAEGECERKRRVCLVERVEFGGD